MLPPRLRNPDGIAPGFDVAHEPPLDLAALLHPPAWHRDAACKERPDVTFFPTRGEPIGPARLVCARCLVQAECLAWALAQEQPPDGVWGGLSLGERRRLRVAA